MNHRALFATRALRHAAAVLALLAGAASAQTAHAPEATADFDSAMAAYERNHWHEAYAALTRLADSGHLDAARMARQMWQYGPQLYGATFEAQPEQLVRWTQLARRAAHRTSNCAAAVAVR